MRKAEPRLEEDGSTINKDDLTMARTTKARSKKDSTIAELESHLHNNIVAINQGLKRKTFSIHDLKSIKPLNQAQRMMMESFYYGNHVIADGSAGTGKSYIGLFMALSEVLRKDSDVKRVIIVRSAVASRNLGFLPGSLDEKMEVFEAPYHDIVGDLLRSHDAYNLCKANGTIEFVSTSYVRGLTWDNAVIVFDEAQNSTIEEIHSIMTRVGDNSRVIICGDYGQNDLVHNRNEISGFLKMIKIAERIESFDIVGFTVNDIVRSAFVKEWITAKEQVL